MGIERHFLGWDGPALPRVVRWLRERYAVAGRGGVWDLSGVLIVVPTGRASRRLLEILAKEAEGVLVPPRIVLPGSLPAELCEIDDDPAGPLRAILARLATLRGAGPGLMHRVLPTPPERDDLVGWWSLAKSVASLADDLAAARLRFVDVAESAAERGMPVSVADRLDALAELEAAYHALLAEEGTIDEGEARLRAIDEGRCRCAKHVVLAATADISPMLEAMLQGAAAHGEVVALVHAPASHAAGFDELGGLISAYWRRQRVPLRDEMLRFVDTPTDQAHAAVRAIADAAEPGPRGRRVTVDRVTVGLGDQALAGAVKRALQLAGLPARFGPGKPFTRSRPALFLAALGRFVAQRRLNDFAELLRHPDVEAALGDVSDAGDDERSAVAHWLTLLDTYATEHLQGRLDGRWLGNQARQAALKAVWDRVHAMLPAATDEVRPLSAWADPVAGALRAVYGDLGLDRTDADDGELLQALEALMEALREVSRLRPDAASTPGVTASQAIAITLGRLADTRLAEESDEPTVELAGYLDLQLDDAPQLVATSMNEGSVPTSHHADPLLPDSVRGELGLTDNARRYARDLMMLCAMVHSRESVTLIAGRRSAEGEPLAPSRLLLACDDVALVARMRRFYGEDRERLEAPTLLVPGAIDRFLVPMPIVPERPIVELSVTAFRDYLACPYRFYLKHVLRLRGLDDGAVELDALAFGNLAHEVLMAFGRDRVRASRDADEVAQFCSHALDDLVAERFGEARRAALAVQVEQLRERLDAFARQQAAWARDGWRIIEARVEDRLQAPVTVDGEPFTIVGRVDRIDRHPDLGYRILDYKTGDSGLTPARTHRATQDGVSVWVDLQLPLYRDLCEPLGVCGQVAVGYINLPKRLGDVRLELADWDDGELSEALRVRDAVIRAVRQGKFWPPAEPPAFGDDFARICADAAVDRRELLARSGEGRG